MNIPDIEGFLLGRALAVLKDEKDLGYSILVTGPPQGVKSRRIDDAFRVVRVRAADGEKLEIMVCDPEA
jgi:hypothetical protein